MTIRLLGCAGLFLAAATSLAEIGRPVRLRATDIEGGAPRLAWTLQATGDVRGIVQTGYEVRVASTAARLNSAHPDLWDSGRVGSPDFAVAYGGAPLAPASRVYWQVRSWQRAEGQAQPEASAWSVPAEFTTGIRQWTAQWIAATPDASAGTAVGVANDKRLPLFRRSVNLRAAPTQALLFISGLGQYEVRVNGRNVTGDVLAPGWTNYRKRILYDIYDVRALLKRGPNALGVLLGNGMYNALAVKGRYSKFSSSYGQPKLIAELHLVFADGTQQTVRTDGAWRTAAGPITFSNTYGGEDFDARLEPPGWDTPGFGEAAWSPVEVVGSPGGVLQANRTSPIRVTEHHAAVAVTHPREGVAVYDLGQNFAGWPVVTASGPAGGTVRLLPGELLDGKGMVTQHSADASPENPADFHYTLRGAGGAETWHPRFSYYGFRYVQVETSDPGVHVAAVAGEAIRSDVPQTGAFTSSNDLLNRTHTLILNAVRSNMVSILTDCPHREKLGWLEQTHLFATSLMLNYDVSALYAKMEDDMADSQDASGLVPSIAPEVTKFLDDQGRSNDFRDSPEWGSAVVLSPWAAFQAYGDIGPLREHYPSMQGYVAFLQGKAQGRLLDYGLGDWYDIGPGEPGYSKLTSKQITAGGTLYEDLEAMAGIASALGKETDAAAYRKQAVALRDAFNAALYHPETGQYDRGSQTANAMPLALGMVPEGKLEGVLNGLVHDIEAHGYHVTAGDVGFHYVVRALTEAGRSDVLAKMLSVTTSPSYGYQLSRGATTLTEAWDTNPSSSQNHFMLGHAEEWFYRGLAGIDVDMSRGPGEQIRIRPYIPDEASGAEDRAAASIDTPLGTVASAWTRKRRELSLEIAVPPNSSATLVFPAGTMGWRESGRPLGGSSGVTVLSGRGELRLVAGTYHFQGTR